MGDEEGYARYFSFLNLFLFFMTVLVLAGNALVMFVGWEGVGLASYLLIGFYFQKKSAADAGKKAFIVNRIGDFGFLIGMFLLLANFGTLTFSAIATNLLRIPAGRAAYSRSSHFAFCWALRENLLSCLFISGCPTPWKARRRSPHSFTRPPWSPPAST